MPRRLAVLAAASALALSLSVLPLDAAARHPRLLRATPAADSRAAAPRQLALTFNEALELALTRVTLVQGDRELKLDSLRLAPGDGSTIIASISGTLAPGRYTVRWQVTGDDGHPVRGAFNFEVIAAGARDEHRGHRSTH